MKDWDVANYLLRTGSFSCVVKFRHAMLKEALCSLAIPNHFNQFFWLLRGLDLIFI